MVQVNLSFAKTNQTITFGALASRSVGETNVPLLATASSLLPVSFSILSGPASITGTNLSVTGAGTVTVQASQTGSTTYNAATPVSQSFIAYALPRMAVTRKGTNCIFSWPTNVAGVALLSATNLVPPVNWVAVSPAPVLISTNYVVTNGLSGASKFYKIKK